MPILPYICNLALGLVFKALNILCVRRGGGRGTLRSARPPGGAPPPGAGVGLGPGGAAGRGAARGRGGPVLTRGGGGGGRAGTDSAYKVSSNYSERYPGPTAMPKAETRSRGADSRFPGGRLWLSIHTRARAPLFVAPSSGTPPQTPTDLRFFVPSSSSLAKAAVKSLKNRSLSLAYIFT